MNLRWCRKYALVLSVLVITGAHAIAQDVLVRGGFLNDSIKVGEETSFYLSARYPKQLNILFPDTTSVFGSFEFRRKEYFPTHTEDTVSTDSVIYYLTTFEVDSTLYLSLPVFQINLQDCTLHKSNQDSILLSHTVKRLPDSLTADLPLKATVAYHDVPYPFNYPVAITMAMVLLITSAVIWFVFGKKIRRQLRLKQMQKAHQKFAAAYTRHLDIVKKEFTIGSAEATLAVWKKYMEQLNARPYTKLTTRETIQLEKDESLGANLRSIDGAIYGHNVNVVPSLENLKMFADQRFTQKLEEVKHG